MNDDFFPAYIEYFIGALVICLLAALMLFCIADGARRMATGAFHLGLAEILVNTATGTAAAWSWWKTSGLIDDTTPRREASKKAPPGGPGPGDRT